MRRLSICKRHEEMVTHKVVPFRCEECGAEFAETQGGVCRACGRVLCRQHLMIQWPKGTRLRHALPPLCQACQQKNVKRLRVDEPDWLEP